MQATSSGKDISAPPSIDLSSPSDVSNTGDEEQGLIAPHTIPSSVRSIVSVPLDDDGSPAEAPSSESSTTGYLKKKTSEVFGAVLASSGLGKPVKAPNSPLTLALATLVGAYSSSDVAAEIKAEGNRLRESVVRSDAAPVSDEPRDVILETSILRGRKRATWATQFRILSGRAFKNLYRDPALLAAHYLSAIGLASTFLTISVILLFVDSSKSSVVFFSITSQTISPASRIDLVSGHFVYAAESNDLC